MTRTAEIRRVIELLEILEEYIHVAGLWEDYYRSAANKEFTLVQDKEAHAHIQRQYMIPLMEECRKKGFQYKELIEIIPTAFKTDKAERRLMLDNLHDWAEQEYGL